MGNKRWTRRECLIRGSGVVLAAGAAAAGGYLLYDPKSNVGLTGVRKPAGAPKPNVLFIMVDTLRADRLGCYGHQRDLTPVMDAIAAQGVRFDLAVAQAPWTQPSIAALFTAMYPGAIIPVEQYRLTFDAVRRGAQAVRVLRDEHVTLAEAMQTQGYTTAGINTNVYVVEEFGYTQGFEHFDAHWPEGFVSEPTTGDVVNEVAIEWLEQRDRSRPFFLYLHYMDVHGPYNAGPEFLDPLLEIVDRMPRKHLLTPKQLAQLDPRYLLKMPKVYTDAARHDRLFRYREYWEARYEAGVAEMDHHLADLRERLTRMGLWKDLVVILTADHGEALGEHGHFGHGWSIRHPELHVPLIIRSPGRLPAGKRVIELVRLMDVMPTLLDHLGLAPIEGIQGVSLLPFIAGDQPDAPLSAFAEGLKAGKLEQIALYRGEWKLAQQIDPRADLLCHITKDPLERTNCVPQNRQLFETLIGIAGAQQKENACLAADAKPEKVPISEEQLRRLKSLGYVGDSAPGDGGG